MPMPIYSLLILALLALPLGAEELKIHGFVAQGIIQADDSNFVEDNGDVSFKLTEVGINASYKLNNQLRIAGQGVYLNGGNRYPEGLRIDYLFVDWQLQNNADWQLKMQLGRNKNYHWLYSSTRDVPHTRPSIILPQSMYFDAFRDFALGVDGIAGMLNTQNSWGEWDLNLSYGSVHVSDKQKANLLGTYAPGDLKHDKDAQMSLFWRPHNSQWLLGLSLLEVEFSYDRSQDDIFVDGQQRTRRINLHALYQGQSWELASEWVREHNVLGGLLFPQYISNTSSDGGYLQARYFVSPTLTLMTRLDVYDRDRKDRHGKQLEIDSGYRIPYYFGFMDQATLGLSWKLAKNLQLQGEYHRVKGTGHLAPVLTPNTIANDSLYWNVWAFQLMYWF